MLRMLSQQIYQCASLYMPYLPFLLSPWESSPICGLSLLLDAVSHPCSPALEFHFCNCHPSIFFVFYKCLSLLLRWDPTDKKHPHDLTSLSNYIPFFLACLWQNHLKELSVFHFWSFQAFLKLLRWSAHPHYSTELHLSWSSGTSLLPHPVLQPVFSSYPSSNGRPVISRTPHSPGFPRTTAVNSSKSPLTIPLPLAGH